MGHNLRIIIILISMALLPQNSLATEEAQMITTKYFGRIDIDWEMEVEIRSEIEINNRKSSCLLMIEPDVKVTDELSKRIDNLSEFDQTARNFFDENGNDGLIGWFIKHHIETFENEIANSLGVTGELTHSKFLNVLKIEQVVVQMSEMNEVLFIVDYSIGTEISNDILVVSFHMNGEIKELMHES